MKPIRVVADVMLEWVGAVPVAAVLELIYYHTLETIFV